MAQVMAHRQVVATRTKLSQKQSTETVQVMLYTSASMLCRMRGMFPPLAFDEVELAEDDELYTFEGLITGKHPCRAEPSSPSSTSTRSSESTKLRVPLLKRGRSDRADQFIESLNTVFEALHRGTLHALRIPFMGDPEINPDPLEIWSFRIVYKKSAEGERKVQGLQAEYNGEDKLDPSLDIDGYVLSLLERISDQCRDSTQLPNECYIQPSIMYTDDGWNPENYVEAKPETTVKGFAGWQPHTTDMGMSVGVSHELAVRSSSLKHEESNKRRISQDFRVRQPGVGHVGRIPTRTSTSPTVVPPIQPRTTSPTGGRKSSSTSAIPETPQHVHIVNKDPTSLASAHALRTVTSKSTSNTDMSQTPATATPTHDEPSQSMVSSTSQVDDDLRRKGSLESMMKPRFNLDDNFLTQPRASASQNSDTEDGPGPELTKHMKTYDFLSREKAHQLWFAIPEIQKRARMLANGPIISCQCQLVDSTEEMAQCSVCGVQQHIICQGYLEGDNRQPPQHVCHFCLLGREADSNGLKKLQGLALQRRAMGLLLSQEVGDAAELGKKLGMEFDKVAELVALLISQGFIVEESGRRTRNSQGKIKFPGSINTPEYVSLLAKLFDPYQVVGHHFSGLPMSDESAGGVSQTLRAKHSILTRPPAQTLSVVSLERERAATATASKKSTSTMKLTTKKRARTAVAEGLATSVQSTPLRRSGRVRTPTPKMKEAKFGFFINAQNLPSRENPGIKSKRFKGDS